jgi:putative Holliday junction resolvase
MRLLALDLGERRIGLAVSNPAGTLVLPAGHLERVKLSLDIDRILDLAQQREVAGIVIGVPYTASGEVGPQARRVLGFIRVLGKRTSLPIHTVDEAFTSFAAESLLREAGRKPSRQRGAVDASAAALILQRFLDQSNPPNTPLSKGGEGGI